MIRLIENQIESIRSVDVNNIGKHLTEFLEIRERIFGNWCIYTGVSMEFTRTLEAFSKNWFRKLERVVLNKVVLLEMMKSLENVEFLELRLSVKHDFKQSDYVKSRILLLAYFSSSTSILFRKFLGFVKVVLYMIVSKNANTPLFRIQIRLLIMRSFVILFIHLKHVIKKPPILAKMN